MFIGGGNTPRISRLPSSIRRGPNFAPAPTVINSALVADNELSGVNSRTLTMTGTSSAGTMLSWVGVLTASFTGPPTANNSNTYTQQFSQNYGTDTLPTEDYTMYTLRGYTSTAAGGSDHTCTVTKSSGDAGELTIAMLLLSGGSIISSAVNIINRANTTGATLTTGTVTVPSGNALLVAVGSGRGDVNDVAPTQTWPGEWTVHQSVARNRATAPSGHIPLYLATRSVGPGTYSVGIQMTNDEGILYGLYAVQ